MIKIFFTLVWLFLFSTYLGGCSDVHPWERGNLAKPQMAVEPNPMQSVLKVHTYSSREAAASGSSAQGGGCGCY